MIEKLAVIGVGLIGGSMARALRQEGLVREVVGCGRGQENLERAIALGVIDHYTQEVGAAVEGADFVLVAVPLGAMRETFAAMRGHLSAAAVVTDVGSARAGVEASFPELFRNRRVILTPLPATSPAAVQRVEWAWRHCGADISRMSVEHHDEVLAATSHLPHMLAFGLVDALARMKDNEEIFRYAAGGFRDFTRIASSNPVMWRDICLANREALSTMLERFSEEMADLAQTIRSADGAHLLEIFQRAKAARDRFVDGVYADPD
jgi:prephenate dehydrogenase